MEKANVKPGHTTNAKKKLLYWKSKKKSKRKSKCKKKMEKGKKGKKKKKANNKQKKGCAFLLLFSFFQKKLEKAEKSKSFFAFSVAFFIFSYLHVFRFIQKSDFLECIFGLFFIAVCLRWIWLT